MRIGMFTAGAAAWVLGATMATAQDYRKLLPDNTAAVVGIDFERLCAAPLVGKFAERFTREMVRGVLRLNSSTDADAEAAAAKRVERQAADLFGRFLKDEAGAREFLRVAGRRVKQLVLATADTGKLFSDPSERIGRTLVILTGEFDEADWMKYLKAAAEVAEGELHRIRHENHDVYTIPRQGMEVYCFCRVDAKTALAAGSFDYITEALDKAAGRRKPDLGKRAAALTAGPPAGAALWVASADEDLPASARLEVAEGLRFELTMTADDQEGARFFAEILMLWGRQLRKMVEAEQKPPDKFGVLVFRLFDAGKITVAGRTVRLSAELDGPAAEKALRD
jgi:hypothetical protein